VDDEIVDIFHRGTPKKFATIHSYYPRLQPKSRRRVQALAEMPPRLSHIPKQRRLVGAAA